MLGTVEMAFRGTRGSSTGGSSGRRSGRSFAPRLTPLNEGMAAAAAGASEDGVLVERVEGGGTAAGGAIGAALEGLSSRFDRVSLGGVDSPRGLTIVGTPSASVAESALSFPGSVPTNVGSGGFGARAPASVAAAPVATAPAPPPLTSRSLPAVSSGGNSGGVEGGLPGPRWTGCRAMGLRA